jgi:hypothetical protein
MIDSSSCFDVIGTGLIKNEVHHNIQNVYVPLQIDDAGNVSVLYVTMILISFARLGRTTSQLVERVGLSIKKRRLSYWQRSKMYVP